MLKQWLVGRKRYSSAHLHPGYIQDPAIIGPLVEKYVVYRTNPIYAEDSHWIADTEIKISPLGHEPKLHVQAWCSSVCPSHLTTCCSCKPAWIYCDNCHPPPPLRRRNPDVVPHKPVTRGTVPDITLNPRNLCLLEEPTMDVSHYYHVIGPSTPPPEDNVGNHRPSQTVSQRKPNNNNVVENNNNGGKNGENPPVLHIYINSDFVRGIEVTGSKPLMNHPYVASASDQPIRGVVSVQADKETANNGVLDISADTDSLDSLRIDEGMFDQDALGTQSVQRLGVMVSGTVEGISPTNSQRLLMDSDVAYEAVKDLYEKLSNNRQRQVLTQAVSGSQRTKVLRNYVQNTYETLTKNSRGHYGKLVEVEAKRSPLYLVPIGSLPRGRPLPEVAQAQPDGPGNNQSLRVLTGLRIETGKRNENHSGRGQTETVPMGNIVPDVAYEVATSDQFITRRDPKYGDQVVQTNYADAAKNANRGFFDGLKKRFKQKNYRDACKIIITTVVGLTAFAIITALSLSINRQ